ncbi:MAG: helix-turn-helix domain-containing protein [Prevotellaceae bacterium]|jgi:transcriptional regulator with XRE-family HTH domain|nr:helix-turn-helix domain-containing protein [Prevotellaceae bacterium]
MNKKDYSHTVHYGNNIKRLREILGVKQEALAVGLGVSQQAISELESKPKIDDETLEKVAKILKITTEAIKNFSEDAVYEAVNIKDSTLNGSALFCNRPVINQDDNLAEMMERFLEKYIALEKKHALTEEKNTALEKEIALLKEKLAASE